MMQRGRSDRGSQFVEFGVYFPLLLLVCALVLELFLSFLALEKMETAARAGARVAGDGGPSQAQVTAKQHLPSYLDDAEIEVARNSDNGYYTTITVKAPILYPATQLNYTLTRRVDMPNA